MVTRFTHKATEQLEELASDVVRLCRGQRAVLQCGRTVIAQSGNEAGPGFVIAAQPFGAGTEAYELTPMDPAPRCRTAAGLEAYAALSDAIRVTHTRCCSKRASSLRLDRTGR